MDKPIRILIADDHPILRDGLRNLLEAAKSSGEKVDLVAPRSVEKRNSSRAWAPESPIRAPAPTGCATI